MCYTNREDDWTFTLTDSPYLLDAIGSYDCGAQTSFQICNKAGTDCVAEGVGPVADSHADLDAAYDTVTLHYHTPFPNPHSEEYGSDDEINAGKPIGAVCHHNSDCKSTWCDWNISPHLCEYCDKEGHSCSREHINSCCPGYWCNEVDDTCIESV